MMFQKTWFLLLKKFILVLNTAVTDNESFHVRILIFLSIDYAFQVFFEISLYVGSQY